MNDIPPAITPVVGTEHSRTSAYSNFILESTRVIQMKETYENQLLALNLESSNSRSNLVNLAKVMVSEIGSLANEQEQARFINSIKTFEQQEKKMEELEDLFPSYSRFEAGPKLMLNAAYNSFKASTEVFLKNFIAVQDRAKLQFSTPQDKMGEMEKFLKVSEIAYKTDNSTPLCFPSAYGIAISPQMEFFCRGLYLRSKTNWDNVIVIEAKRGRGKSSLALTIATTLSTMLHTTFDIDSHILFTESKQYCTNLLGTLPKHSSIIFDQAGAQLGNRSSMEREQIDLTNMADLNRFHGLTQLFLWHDIASVDKDIRERVATHYLTIEKRGVANLKTFNLNPAQRGITHTQKEKEKLVLTPDMAQEATELSATTIFQIPYLPLEKDNTQVAENLWDVYNQRKEKSANIKAVRKPKKL